MCYLPLHILTEYAANSTPIKPNTRISMLAVVVSILDKGYLHDRPICIDGETIVDGRRRIAAIGWILDKVPGFYGEAFPHGIPIEHAIK